MVHLSHCSASLCIGRIRSTGSIVFRFLILCRQLFLGIMRKAAFILFASLGGLVSGQDLARYDSLINEANARYEAKDFAASAKLFSSAFGSLGWRGYPNDRYNAACNWALSYVPDSAFSQLRLISEKMDFRDWDLITNDTDLVSLHADPRWEPVIDRVKANKEKAEANWDRPLVHTLDSVYEEDQRYRQQLDEVEQQYGRGSAQMKALWRKMNEVDSTDLLLVTKILDERGWLGPDIIGDQGNMTLFLVIQHSDQAAQERYLPMMRAAVAKGDAIGSDLALLEDRVALGEGKRQVYGSQIGRDDDTGEYYVLPLEDPDNVDVRRKTVGLSPIADYLGNWDMKWDPEKYKAQLPALEAKQREQRK